MTGYDPEVHRRWYQRNAEKKRAYSRAHYAANREKRIAYAKQRRVSNPREWWPSHLKRMYGLTVDDFEKLRQAQSNTCAICELEFDDSSKSTIPHIDHNHETGKVRGILCSACNTSLGHVERPGFLVAAMDYLKKHGSKA